MTSQIKSPNPNSDVSIVEPSFITKLFASALFSGYSPIASGTVGSAVALALYFIPGFESPIIIGLVTLSVFILGVRAANLMERRYGHDPSVVTIDEVVGMWISLILLPKTFIIAIAAFLLFRLLDIIKPSPARKFDNMNGGFGIMMDDVIAGIYTNIILQLALLIPAFKEIL